MEDYHALSSLTLPTEGSLVTPTDVKLGLWQAEILPARRLGISPC